MDPEGIGLEVSGEWLQGTATGILLLLALYWIPALLNRVWRRVLWREGASTLASLSKTLGSPVVPSRAGWLVRGARGQVRVSGGIHGVRTELRRVDGTRQLYPGWLTVAEVEAWLDLRSD